MLVNYKCFTIAANESRKIFEITGALGHPSSRQRPVCQALLAVGGRLFILSSINLFSLFFTFLILQKGFTVHEEKKKRE